MANEVSIPPGVKFIYAPLRDGTPCLITNMSGDVLFQNQDVPAEARQLVASHVSKYIR